MKLKHCLFVSLLLLLLLLLRQKQSLKPGIGELTMVYSHIILQ